MSAFELFMAIGGTLLVIFFLTQAMHRDREPDGYKHRDGLVAMARLRVKGKPSVPLRPAAAKLLAAKERTARHDKPVRPPRGPDEADSPEPKI